MKNLKMFSDLIQDGESGAEVAEVDQLVDCVQIMVNDLVGDRS